MDILRKKCFLLMMILFFLQITRGMASAVELTLNITGFTPISKIISVNPSTTIGSLKEEVINEIGEIYRPYITLYLCKEDLGKLSCIMRLGSLKDEDTLNDVAKSIEDFAFKDLSSVVCSAHITVMTPTVKVGNVSYPGPFLNLNKIIKDNLLESIAHYLQNADNDPSACTHKFWFAPGKYLIKNLGNGKIEINLIAKKSPPYSHLIIKKKL